MSIEISRCCKPETSLSQTDISFSWKTSNFIGITITLYFSYISNCIFFNASSSTSRIIKFILFFAKSNANALPIPLAPPVIMA